MDEEISEYYNKGHMVVGSKEVCWWSQHASNNMRLQLQEETWF